MTTSDPDLVVCEAVLRDGIQGWPTFISTASKVKILDAVAAAGVREIDVTSFVPARVVPQFADALDVLAAVPASVATRVLTVNVKGARRVIEAGSAVRTVDRCGIPYSVSEPHNLANLRRTHTEHREVVAEMVDLLGSAGIDPLLGVATAYGCPVQGRVPLDDVLAVVDWAHGIGVRTLMFGDTTGTADPRTVRELFTLTLSTWPDLHLVAHFHDNRGLGVANALTAIECGAGTVDSSLGGLGGEPASVDQGDVGESGNVATEDLVAGLGRMGRRTGIDPAAVLSAGALVEQLLGRPLHSRVQRAGLVPFEPRGTVEQGKV